MGCRIVFKGKGNTTVLGEQERKRGGKKERNLSRVSWSHFKTLLWSHRRRFGRYFSLILKQQYLKCQTEETYLWCEKNPPLLSLLCCHTSGNTAALPPFSFFSMESWIWENPRLSPPPPSAFTSGSVGLVGAGCCFQRALVLLYIWKFGSCKHCFFFWRSRWTS